MEAERLAMKSMMRAALPKGRAVSSAMTAPLKSVAACSLILATWADMGAAAMLCSVPEMAPIVLLDCSGARATSNKFLSACVQWGIR